MSLVAVERVLDEVPQPRSRTEADIAEQIARHRVAEGVVGEQQLVPDASGCPVGAVVWLCQDDGWLVEADVVLEIGEIGWARELGDVDCSENK